jgi:hypothetical protein
VPRAFVSLSLAPSPWPIMPALRDSRSLATWWCFFGKEVATFPAFLWAAACHPPVSKSRILADAHAPVRSARCSLLMAGGGGGGVGRAGDFIECR